MVLAADVLVILAQVFVFVCRSDVYGDIFPAASFCNLGAVGQRNGNTDCVVYVQEICSGCVQEAGGGNSA